MKKFLLITLLIVITIFGAAGQCSICTKTAQQLGDGPAHGLNGGIIYLACIPLIAFFIIGLRWWKNEKKENGGKFF